MSGRIREPSVQIDSSMMRVTCYRGATPGCPSPRGGVCVWVRRSPRPRSTSHWCTLSEGTASSHQMAYSSTLLSEARDRLCYTTHLKSSWQRGNEIHWISMFRGTAGALNACIHLHTKQPDYCNRGYQEHNGNFVGIGRSKPRILLFIKLPAVSGWVNFKKNV